MNVTFAANQVLTTDGQPVSITTDPVSLDGNDRISTIAVAHYIYGADAVLKYYSQVSYDGVYWVQQGVDEATGITTAETPAQRPGQTVNGAFVRLVITFDASATAAVCFDIHGVLDKQ